MYKLKMQSEKICDYCNVRYPDERSLMVHEFIHVDRDMDYFRSCSEISDELNYLPKARRLLPDDLHNNRFFEIGYRKIEINVPGIGKRYSRMLLISDAIDELLYLCKKYPVRESTESPCNPLETSMSDNTSISLNTPPSYTTSYSLCSSDSESFSATSSSESDESETEPEQIEAETIEKEKLADHPINDASPSNSTHPFKRESSSDSGYGSSPQKCSSEFMKEDSISPITESESIDSYSKTEINDLLKNIVSYAAGGGYCFKTIDLDKFKSVVEKPVSDEFATLQNRKCIAQDSNKSIFDSNCNSNDNGINPIEKAAGNLYSMPQILC